MGNVGRVFGALSMVERLCVQLIGGVAPFPRGIQIVWNLSVVIAPVWIGSVATVRLRPARIGEIAATDRLGDESVAGVGTLGVICGDHVVIIENLVEHIAVVLGPADATQRHPREATIGSAAMPDVQPTIERRFDRRVDGCIVKLQHQLAAAAIDGVHRIELVVVAIAQLDGVTVIVLGEPRVLRRVAIIDGGQHRSTAAGPV